MDSHQNSIRQFIVENFLFGKEDEPIQPSDSLLERGVIDSTGVLELVGFLEKTYGIIINDEELVPDNLDSIERITQFLDRKLQVAGASA